MDTGRRTFCKENKKDSSELTAFPARDIIIARQRRVVCAVCGKTIGGAVPGEDPTGSIFYCRICHGYRRVKVNTVPEP